ncbi:hypothetical protein C4D60_Mb02t16200 [Musa balbisiana]|uniref:Uncharacterized protein n=1 Tax=Musa balbisiana TaxID=52838 RepID=A0A4S8ICG6_MUSBA|nr:hypothetical protein C4D60_Mb02t16200 [Musa balbisiana]
MCWRSPSQSPRNMDMNTASTLLFAPSVWAMLTRRSRSSSSSFHPSHGVFYVDAHRPEVGQIDQDKAALLLGSVRQAFVVVPAAPNSDRQAVIPAADDRCLNLGCISRSDDEEGFWCFRGSESEVLDGGIEEGEVGRAVGKVEETRPVGEG